MSTFEALKLAYQRSMGLQEPGVLALLVLSFDEEPKKGPKRRRRCLLGPR